ncbi:Myc-type, basic helix-loop-helix (bHLH) domain [Dillenia turbinata]|uniref:Myc-type, basic helix-loop-helix (BHLH) domain n=1 Tax=Dillenia turbinata TaxID=194707 RepID=A0AAN8VV55_9MAGN
MLGLIHLQSLKGGGEKAMATDQCRRIRIAERLEALRQVLPYSARGSSVDVVDDAICQIKQLQFQIKGMSTHNEFRKTQSRARVELQCLTLPELSRSRLRDGPLPDPFAVLGMMPDEQLERGDGHLAQGKSIRSNPTVGESGTLHIANGFG